jgi:hypothetical protein
LDAGLTRRSFIGVSIGAALTALVGPSTVASAAPNGPALDSRSRKAFATLSAAVAVRSGGTADPGCVRSSTNAFGLWFETADPSARETARAVFQGLDGASGGDYGSLGSRAAAEVLGRLQQATNESGARSPAPHFVVPPDRSATSGAFQRHALADAAIRLTALGETSLEAPYIPKAA